MIIPRRVLFASAAIFALLGNAHAADYPPFNVGPPSSPVPPHSCTDPKDFLLTDCQLSWYGITAFGAIDMGAGYHTHGVRLNDSLVSGVQELVMKSSNRPQFVPVPGGLQQSFVGLKVKEEVTPGWFVVGELSFGFDPYTFTPSNGPRSFLENNGVPLDQQSGTGDSSRAGQFYNGTGYVGISNETFGKLTFGRQNSLSLDGVIAYDPMQTSYAFSVIGYQGIASGGGDTEDARSTTALKYRGEFGMFRVGAFYQIGGYDQNNGAQGEYNVSVGGTFPLAAYGTLAVDAIYNNDQGAVSSAALSSAQNLVNPGTIAATVSDNESYMALAKYTYKRVRVYAGYENIAFRNPAHPQLTSFTDIAGIVSVAANINNTAYTNPRHLQIMWTGARYDFTENVDGGVGYYHYIQDNYNTVFCKNSSAGSCAGTLNAGSIDVDWRINKKFDAYAGLMYSQVLNGLRSGYLHNNNLAPAAGLRLRF